MNMKERPDAVEIPVGVLPVENSEAAAVGMPSDDEVPDGGYGWVCVLCVTTLNAFTWGIAATYGVFLAHYLSNNVFSSATILDYGFIGGLNFGMALLCSTPATILVRRSTLQTPMYMGVILQCAGFIAASFATRIWHLYLSQGLLVGLGIGFTWVPSSPIVSQWFAAKRSLVNGITAAGVGIGGLIFSFAIQAIIRDMSLAWALRITGIVPGLTNLLATAFIRSRHKAIQPTLHGFDLALLRNPKVLLLLSFAFTSMLGYITILYSLSDFGRSLGLSSSKSASVTAVLNIGTLVGRPTLGVLSDRYGRMLVAFLTSSACAISVFALWIPAQSYALLVVFALVCGAILGIFWQSISPLSVEVVGLKHQPSLLAITWAAILLPCTFSEVIALQIRRPGHAHAYLYPQIYAGCSYLVASAMMGALWWMHHKR